VLSTGGLADVVTALSKALYAEGHDVRIVMPCYRGIPDAYRGEEYCMCVADFGGHMEYGALRKSFLPGTDIPLYLIEHEGYFGRDEPYGVGATEYEDNARRFCFFCLAALSGVPQNNWIPDVLHCHDWHAAPIPIYLKSRFKKDLVWGGKPTLFTIHNLAHQGRYPKAKFAFTGMGEELFTPECLEYYGDMNLMKGALNLADKLSTVSPRYAREIQTEDYGAGLDGILRSRRKDVHGILNGVDYQSWHPGTDNLIAANYSADALSGKARCKADLQAMFGLPKKKVPVFGVVSRLFWQKGIDFMVDALDRVLKKDVQFVIQGTGNPELEQTLEAMVEKYPGKFAISLAYDAALAHKIQAGSDFFCMPSRYEPCGLTQLYSMAYGTVPIARRTGGLADTIKDLNAVHREEGTATGITFVARTSGAFAKAVDRALAVYKDTGLMNTIRKNGMTASFDWNRSCLEYVDLFRTLAASSE
jgi:starch synthase